MTTPIKNIHFQPNTKGLHAPNINTAPNNASLGKHELEGTIRGPFPGSIIKQDHWGHDIRPFRLFISKSYRYTTIHMQKCHLNLQPVNTV